MKEYDWIREAPEQGNEVMITENQQDLIWVLLAQMPVVTVVLSKEHSTHLDLIQIHRYPQLECLGDPHFQNCMTVFIHEKLNIQHNTLYVQNRWLAPTIIDNPEAHVLLDELEVDYNEDCYEEDEGNESHDNLVCHNPSGHAPENFAGPTNIVICAVQRVSWAFYGFSLPRQILKNAHS